MASVHAHSFSVVPVLSLHLISSITLGLIHRYSKTQAFQSLQLLLSASSWHDHISVPSLSTSLITFFFFFSGAWFFFYFIIIPHKEIPCWSLIFSLFVFICYCVCVGACVCTVDCGATSVPHRTQISKLRPTNPPWDLLKPLRSVIYISHKHTHTHTRALYINSNAYTPTSIHARMHTHQRFELRGFKTSLVAMKMSGKKCIRVWSCIQWT